MNKRIQELMQQSMVEYQFDMRVSPEKFAQWVLAEYAEIALLDGQTTGNFEVFNKIQKHFGVEE